MKNKMLWSIFLSLAVAVLFPALPVREAACADAAKLGYVDLRVALNESEQGKKAKAELESLIKTKQSAIDERGKSIEKLKADIEKQASVLSPEARKSKEEEAERLVRDYQRFVQDSQNELKKKENEATVQILKEIREIVERVGKEEGYSMILENVEGIILFAKKDLDMTERFIKLYNESKAKKK